MCDEPRCRSEKACDPCSVDGKKVEAKHFCVHCFEYLCITCAQYHSKYKQSRAHVILNYLPEDTSIYERVLNFSNYSFHPEIEIGRLCKRHDKMLCRLCSDIHASCQNVVKIEDCQKGNIDAIPDKLTALKSMYSTHKKELDRQLEELLVNSLDVKNNIREYVQQIREVADKVEQSLNENHQSLISPAYAIIKQGLENVEEKEVKLNECKIFHDIMPKMCSTKDQNILIWKLNQLMNASLLHQDRAFLYTRMISPLRKKELFAELFKCEVKFLINEELTQEKFSDEDTSSAGCYVSMNEYEQIKDKREHNNVLECGTAPLKEGEEKSIYSHIEELVKDSDNQLDVNDDYPFLKMILDQKDAVFNIHRTDIAENGICNIATLDVLSDGRIILIDDGQMVLKLFSTEFTFISCMVLAHKPLDMCVVEEKEDKSFTVAVCFEGQN